LITVDTLRADHVGAYGHARARTPALDGLAASGTLFERAYAAAPITLPSHATLLTGRYPPGHGARDNGLHVSPTVPTLATELKARGFRTAAFVAAFPLDHQFGLNRGFDVYSDHLPRGSDGRLANERPASEVIAEAIAWLRIDQRPTTNDHFFSGSTSSSRTRHTAIHRRLARPPGRYSIGTTMRSRPPIARSGGC
jgi:arylsulfatase A-like enzyme